MEGNNWYLSDSVAVGWKDKRYSRGFSFLLYIVNLIIKIVLWRNLNKFRKG